MSKEHEPVHVTPYGRAWVVRMANNAAPISVHSNVHDAVEHGRRIAGERAVELVVFNKDWEVQSRENLGGE